MSDSEMIEDLSFKNLEKAQKLKYFKTFLGSEKK